MISKLPKHMQTQSNQENIRGAKALGISILLHLFILLLFWVGQERLISIPAPKNPKKFTLNLSQFVTPPPTPKPRMVPPPTPTVQPTPTQKPKPKKKSLQTKKTLALERADREDNITKSPKSVVLKKTPPKKVEKEKRAIARPSRSPKRYNTPLANSLMGSKQARNMRQVPSSLPRSNPAKRMIKQLYGSEFDGYSKEQKKFIEDNLMIIHRITQMTLNRKGYPQIAARTGQEGVNIVSFYLHPNGNITSLRLDREMGYEALDQNTLEVIRIAYKDYPLPRKKTKIKFFVQYSIGRY